MSVTRIVCDGCGFAQQHCMCEASAQERTNVVYNKYAYRTLRGIKSADLKEVHDDLYWAMTGERIGEHENNE